MGLNKENKIVAGEWLSFMEERGALAGKVASKLISKRWFHGSEVTLPNCVRCNRYTASSTQYFRCMERELMFTRVCSATQANAHFAIALVLVNMFPLGIWTFQVLFPSTWRRTAGVYKDEACCRALINSNDHITYSGWPAITQNPPLTS